MAIKYGRGKHPTHENYILYMQEIVENPTYSDMPNAVDENGRINWQVSSGKKTSFYKYYVDRFNWWINKADSLNLPGNGNSDDRFTIAARRMHPTGKRPCRLCGVERYVGYMYTNHHLSNKWSKILESTPITKGMDILSAVDTLLGEMENEEVITLLQKEFPERAQFFGVLPDFEAFFVKTQHIPSTRLSPGFMGNPPDRLDGFHDYGLCCRKTKDPGRFDENMRSYNHDRRAFQWWAEGDWIVADALYNKASAGECSQCGKHVGKISPDHIGPLSCGFKQMPFFEPLCNRCNSSKNRRFTYSDVEKLRNYEKQTNDSVVSWQVRTLWDNAKVHIRNDLDAKLLSNYMRSMQDYYIRFLNSLRLNGLTMLLSYYLNPKNAFYVVEFENLDSGKLTYSKYTKTYKETKSKKSLVSRTVRIAFDELENYSSNERKVKKLEFLDYDDINRVVKEIVQLSSSSKLPREMMQLWDNAINHIETPLEKEQAIEDLLFDEKYEKYFSLFSEIKGSLEKHFQSVGNKAYKQFMKEM